MPGMPTGSDFAGTGRARPPAQVSTSAQRASKDPVACRHPQSTVSLQARLHPPSALGDNSGLRSPQDLGSRFRVTISPPAVSLASTTSTTNPQAAEMTAVDTEALSASSAYLSVRNAPPEGGSAILSAIVLKRERAPADICACSSALCHAQTLTDSTSLATVAMASPLRDPRDPAR